nr:C25 family cysteine peptidase [Bacteroidota bacterium]
MRTIIYTSILFILASFQIANCQMVVGQDTLIGNEWIKYDQKYYKFFVETDGVFRITKAAMRAAGFPESEIDGSKLRAYNLGNQIPIFVSNEGLFNDGDFIEFHGKKNRSELDRFLFRKPAEDLLNPDHSLYSDRNPYFLTYRGDGNPLRVNNLISDFSNIPPAEEYFLHTESVNFSSEQFKPYYPLSGGGAVAYSSYMHGEGFGKPSENSSVTSVPTIDRYDSGNDVLVHVRFVTTNYGSHSYVVSLNDQTLDTVDVVDLKISDNNYSVPLNLLADNNQLKLTALVPGSRHSVVAVDITYHQLALKASFPIAQITLDGQAGRQFIRLHDLVSSQHVIYTADGTTRMMTNTQSEFVWPEVLSDLSLFIVDEATGVVDLTALEEKTFTDISSNNTEFVIITNPALMEIGASSAYAQYRSSADGGGYNTYAYSIFDIYDQFGYGVEKHPQSIRNFVEMMHRQWSSAEFIFIVGRAIEYNRSRYPGTWEPWFYVPTFGKAGSDNLLAATLWDLVPRYPVGRLAITDAHGVEVYLNKLKEHDDVVHLPQTLEDKGWIKNVMHIGGGKTASEQSDFKSTLNSLANIIEENEYGANVHFFHKETTDIIGESQSKQIEKLLNEGNSIVNYLGHSSATTFEFNINEADEWNNKGRYPVFSAMGCSAGAIHGTLLSLSDRYVQIADEGAIAFISGSSSQFASALIKWAKPLYEYIGGEGYYNTVGEANLVGLREVATFVNPVLVNSNQYRYLLEQQTYQGDPAIKLHPMPGPDYLVDKSSVRIGPDILNTKLDSFTLSFKIANIGRNLHQQVTYSVHIQKGDGQIVNIHEGVFEANTFETEVSLILPLSIGRKAGLYRLLVIVDPRQTIAELPAPMAESNNTLTDNLGVAGIPFVVVDNLVSAVYPPDFGIVTSGTPQLVATSSNSFIKKQNIVLEIDTTALFNSPALVHEKFINHAATLKWSPVSALTPGQVYYWRVSTDSVSPTQDYIWSRRSFLYQPGSREGWNQSHFYQFTDNVLVSIQPDSVKRGFLYTQSNKNFRMLNRYHDVDQGLVPFFFEDGKFNAKLAQRFRNKNVHGFVVAIDSITGNYLMNTVEGLYGSVPDPLPMEGFAYDLTTAVSRQNMINLIENVIPAGYYVFFYTYQHTGFLDFKPEEWAQDESNFGKSIFSVIENQYPESVIRTLDTAGSKPYIILFQKDRGIIEEQIAENVDGVISISFDIGVSGTIGKYISVPVGPASKWYSIDLKIATPLDTNGMQLVAAFALNEDLTDTLWISHDITSTSINISDLDAVTYPYIQLSFITGDSVEFTPSLIDYWRVYFDGYPELIINPDEGFLYEKDSLEQGQNMVLTTVIENVSPYTVDSFAVSLKLISTDNSVEELRKTILGLPGYAQTPISFIKVTDQMKGDYQVLMDVNPSRVISENNYLNNIGILPLHVEGDGLNPILDVTFDGQHILDGDLVASKPLIAIQLHDENQYLRLDDTSSFALFLKYPSESQPRPVSFSEGWVQFIQATGSGKNVASVELRPELSEDGIYELQVEALDASGNLAGDNDYYIS